MGIDNYSQSQKEFLFGRMKTAFGKGIIAGIIVLALIILSGVKSGNLYKLGRLEKLGPVIIAVLAMGGAVANWSIMNAKRNINGKESIYIKMTNLSGGILFFGVVIVAPVVIIFNVLEYFKLKKELTKK